MQGTEPTAGAQRRLAYLRDLFGRGSYPDDRPTSGEDPQTSIGLELDASGWVLHADVRRLDDALRDGPTLRGALIRAYHAAERNRLVREAAEQPPMADELASGRELLEGRRTVRVPVAVTLAPITRPEAPVDVPDPAGLPDPARVVRGVSRDGEVAVTAVVTNGLDDLTADPDWLRHTSADFLRYALNEAFADAYRQGERP